MFKQVFAQQPDSLFVWPIVALIAFAGVFVAQLIVIARRDVDAQAALPLNEKEEVSRAS